MDNTDKRTSYFAIIIGLLIVVSNIQSLFGYNAQTMDFFMGMTLILVGCYSWFGSRILIFIKFNRKIFLHCANYKHEAKTIVKGRSGKSKLNTVLICLDVL